MKYDLFSISRTVPALTLILLLSCCRTHVQEQASSAAPQARPNITSLISPRNGLIITCGDSVEISLSQPAAGIKMDSLVVLAAKNQPLRITGNQWHGYWKSGKNKVGQITLKITAYYDDSLQESHAAGLVVLSDVVPKTYTYKVIKQYPHDADAYTQGLIYDNGRLYESTGLEEKSSVRIVNIATGKPEKMVALAKEFFGEGLALYKDQLYQVTYKSQVGFVYDKKSLELIRSFDYQIREGWGLTTDGQYLVMSDGSSQLYFIEPEFFTQVDQIDVFDNKGMIPSLNELEFINGKILANVYGEDYIVIIDPLSGKVTGKLDLHLLMPKGSQGDMSKVLNGIAYNPQTGHVYVTGKDWPVLYEIELTPAL
jgi:glutaminyl-peptide cyclotransferase